MKKVSMKSVGIFVLCLLVELSFGQSISGFVKDKYENPIIGASVRLDKTQKGAITDTTGFFRIDSIEAGEYTIFINAIGIEPISKKIQVDESQENQELQILATLTEEIESIVVSGALRETEIKESPILVEVYSDRFLQKNPTSNFFDALQNINGIRPQITCSVCGTGGIQINGMEAPYTMVLIDGMPIVSGLGTVYGLSGIPSSLIKRIEIVKGSASTLYGSEAVGGLINIITKNAKQADRFAVDIFSTSHLENNADVSFSKKTGKFSTLLSANVFYFNSKRDVNEDNFIDLPLQKRFSVFNKWNLERSDQKQSSLAWRYIYENRMGGVMQFTNNLRGSDQIYGESVFTNRFELLGQYDLPVKEKISLMYSFNMHHQDSYYGDIYYLSKQHIAFGQMLWDKQISKKTSMLAGLAFRYTFYDDNSPATAAPDNIDVNQPSIIYLPGFFVQNETKFNDKHSIVWAGRYDYNSAHGSVLTPRFAYKFSPNEDNILRLNVGKGFRVVNLFTEDHAALTGARQVVIANDLKPEQSWNANLSYQKTFVWKNNLFTLENNVFYTYFTNRILPDYFSNPNQIIYDNLDGFSLVRGYSLNADWLNDKGLKLNAGFTLMQSFIEENRKRQNQVLVSPFSATFSLSYTFARLKSTIDWTGNMFSPMPLVVVENDFRPEKSPWYSIQNVQITTKINEKLQIYGGLKNLLNFIPQNPLFNPSQPFSDTFDTAYGFAPIQGIRGFLGLRWHLH